MSAEEEQKHDDDPVAEEDGTGVVIENPSTSKMGTSNHRSTHSQGMESSVLRFKNVNFVVGKKDKQKNILTDVSGTVKWGHVLAIMGPSGAGKTTLVSALTLEGLYGEATGKVTLNGVPLTDKIFKSHCYVVKQHDKHWPYLTCRETLMFAAELYDVAVNRAEMALVVDEILDKMGLKVCENTRNGSLSGGQRRRLSIGIALLKQPTMLFLDEPTSGLDAASASNIMREIVRVAKEERLIIICTIHQPSTKVYQGFDELMLMSRGREAFSGDVNEAIPYFESIGHPCPPATNPAEFFLDLVNSDFSDESVVTGILNTWQEKRPDGGNSSHHKKGFDDEEQQGVVDMKRAPLRKELMIMFRRHGALIVRDPILYIGRCLIFFVSCLIFAIVYWNARDFTQDQAINKMWVSIWFVGVPSNMGVVAVYALNDEFKSILRETKNGMVTGISYVLAKFILVLPLFFVFAIFSLGIPSYAVQDVPAESFGICVLLFACLMFVFESLAEMLSVWFEDPILGMLQFMNFWFASFLFGGFLIPLDDLYWPFELFYYIMPYSYYVRSNIYETFSASTFEACTNQGVSAVCVNSTSGIEVLGDLERFFPVLSTENSTVFDLGILLLIGAVYKVLYIIGILYKTSLVAPIKNVEGL
jgi:ABC-type multidrug transport system ATPase subunit